MKKLEDYGYSITDNSARKRHRALGRACRALGYRKVYQRLASRKSRATGYKNKRYRADRNWVKEKAGKVNVAIF